MKTTALEPGLLSVFRLFAALRLGLLALAYLINFLIPALPEYMIAPWPVLIFSLASSSLLIFYLFFPGLPQRLGRIYLPLAIFLASTGPIIEQNLLMRAQIGSPFTSYMFTAWQLIPLLFVPLVITGWQYTYGSVVFFSLSTLFLDWGLTMTVVNGPDMRLIPLGSALFIRTVSFLLVGYMVVRLMNNQRRQRSALAEANRQLTHYAATLEQLATSRERNRLARELHDTLAHSLSGIAVQLEAVRTLWDRSPTDARQMLDKSLGTTRSGLAETRRALQALRAAPLEDLGLGLALKGLAHSVAERADLELEFEAPERLENLSPDLEQGVYRIAQEALENVARHSEARKVSVRLAQTNGQAGGLSLTIRDDGLGFDPASLSLENRFGLRGMRERAEILGGELEIDSGPGRGAAIRLTWGGDS